MTANTTAEVRNESCIGVQTKECLMKRLVLTVAAVALFGWVTPVQATPIAYTETVTGTGTLDGISFTNALVSRSRGIRLPS